MYRSKFLRQVRSELSRGGAALKRAENGQLDLDIALSIARGSADVAARLLSAQEKEKITLEDDPPAPATTDSTNDTGRPLHNEPTGKKRGHKPAGVAAKEESPS